MADDNLYRPLHEDEIIQLERQHCTAGNWQRVKVTEHFEPNHIRYVHFSGDIRLGLFSKTFTLTGGMEKHAGISNAILHNCIVDDDVLIESISGQIANYTIGKGCLIQNVNLMVVEGRSSFGNGVEVAVLNESGGREVPIFNELSAHLAYIIALYRHYPVLMNKLKTMIREYTASVSSDRGTVGKEVSITNVGSIRNVCIGDHAVISGTLRMQNGSINSNVHAPVFIGHGVTLEDFIVSSGAVVSDGARMVQCFIGQACRFSSLFSAHNSLFFSNCQGENGEACAVFAGPYTVTMHKSSLLIAGMFSFLNAGSGSNQSNHLYKLGPIHQGIVERGSKTTSDSYLLWPAKIGAFSLIMGRHVNHPDTSELPFSYLIEEDNSTQLVPGVNLRSVGTIRDAQKWPKRDKRTDPNLLDCINFNLLSPYTIRQMLRGVDILHRLQETSGKDTKEYTYQQAYIKNDSLKKGIRYYSMAIHKFLGNSLIKRLESIRFEQEDEIRKRLQPDTEQGSGEWVDLSGLIAPCGEIIGLIRRIESEEINSLEQIRNTFKRWHAGYYKLEWTWAWEVIQQWYNVSINTITAKKIAGIVNDWKNAVITLDNMFYEDARKEFSLMAQIEMVPYTSEDTPNRNEQAQSDFENNPFVQAVQQHIETKRALGDELISRIEKFIIH